MELKKTKEELGTLSLRDHRTVPIELLNCIDGINTILNFEPLTEDQILIIANFIFSEFPAFTVNEILDAVYKGNAGKLGTKEECDPTAYGKIDIDYFGRILRGYKKYKIDQGLLAKMTLPNPNLKQLEMKKDENYYLECKKSYDFILKVVTEEKKLPWIAAWASAYDYMVKETLIEEDEDEMELHKSILVDKIKREIMELKVMRKSYGHLATTLQSEANLTIHYKAEVVKDHFKKELSRKP